MKKSRSFIALCSLAAAVAFTTACSIERSSSTLASSGTSCLGPIQGAETLRLASSTPAAAPAPAPTPTPAPAPAPAPGGGDQVDLHQAIIRGGSPDVASWPVTAAITAIDINGGGI